MCINPAPPSIDNLDKIWQFELLPQERKFNILRMLLSLINHSATCKGECGEKNCRTMKQRLIHFRTCKGSNICRQAFCFVYQALINHLVDCKNLQCSFCLPLKAEISKMQINLALSNEHNNPIQDVTVRSNDLSPAQICEMDARYAHNQPVNTNSINSGGQTREVTTSTTEGENDPIETNATVNKQGERPVIARTIMHQPTQNLTNKTHLTQNTIKGQRANHYQKQVIISAAGTRRVFRQRKYSWGAFNGNRHSANPSIVENSSVVNSLYKDSFRIAKQSVGLNPGNPYFRTRFAQNLQSITSDQGTVHSKLVNRTPASQRTNVKQKACHRTEISANVDEANPDVLNPVTTKKNPNVRRIYQINPISSDQNTVRNPSYFTALHNSAMLNSPKKSTINRHPHQTINPVSKTESYSNRVTDTYSILSEIQERQTAPNLQRGQNPLKCIKSRSGVTPQEKSLNLSIRKEEKPIHSIYSKSMNISSNVTANGAAFQGPQLMERDTGEKLDPLPNLNSQKGSTIDRQPHQIISSVSNAGNYSNQIIGTDYNFPKTQVNQPTFDLQRSQISSKYTKIRSGVIARKKSLTLFAKREGKPAHIRYSENTNISANLPANVALSTKREATGNSNSTANLRVLNDNWNPHLIESSCRKIKNISSNELQNHSTGILDVDELESSGSSKHINKSKCKTWTQDEFRKKFVELLEKINRNDDSEPFRVPVDPVALKTPDYLKIVKHPMDLSTIRIKLENGAYNNPWEVVDDFHLIFRNAKLYYKTSTKVYKQCERVRLNYI